MTNKKNNLIFLILLFTACNKENISNDIEYKRFVGIWISDEGEPFEVEFKKNGKIVVFKSVERGRSFKVSDYTKELTDAYKTNGIFWDEFDFKNESLLNKKSATFTINPTNDSIYFYNSKKIDDFTADSTSYSVLLVRK